MTTDNNYISPSVEIYIPAEGFSNYLISTRGRVYNRRGGWPIKGGTDSEGYVRLGLVSDDGTIKNVGRHRLMLLTFKPIENPTQMTSNHTNGVKGDDRIENLEWATVQENLLHAGRLGLTPSCYPISVRDIDTGQIFKFNSYTECAQEIGLGGRHAVQYRISFGEQYAFPERKQYRFGWSDEPWLQPQNLDQLPRKAQCSHGKAVSILVHFLTDGSIMQFEQMQDVANYLGCSPAVISERIRMPGQPVFPPQLFQIKTADDPSPWRHVEDPYREIADNTEYTPVRVYDTISGQQYIYLSANECARAHGLSPTCLSYRLKASAGAYPYSDGCCYSYY